MRDLHTFSGPRVYVETVEEALEKVRAVFPTATKEGSLGAWCFSAEGKVVAEMWMHRTRPGWWVRIKNS